MAGFFQTVTDVDADCDALKNRAYGVIEVREQEFHAVHLRPFPKMISIAEIKWATFWKNQSFTKTGADRVLLYYNQPIMHRNFLALKYFVSDQKSTLASIAVSLSILDFIAKLKRTDAMVTEITNKRIKDRHLSHFGWEEHLQQDRGRHWIKRFYGQYPETFLFQELQQSSARAQAEPEPKQKPVHKKPAIVSFGTNESAANSMHAEVH